MNDSKPTHVSPSPVKGKFELGHRVATPAAISAISAACGNEDTFNIEIANVTARHVQGDWGEIDDEDKGLNDAAIANEGDFSKMSRVLSVYTIRGVKVWLITEADRSVTVLMLPSDY